MKEKLSKFQSLFDEEYVENAVQNILGSFKEGWAMGRNQPNFTITNKTDKISIRSDLPGYEKKDIKITVKNGILTVKGENKQEENKDSIWRSSLSSFSQSWSLPHEAVVNDIEADVKAGVLVITVPLKEQEEPEEVEIKVG